MCLFELKTNIKTQVNSIKNYLIMRFYIPVKIVNKLNEIQKLN